jgi:hypothetical protein
VTVADLRPLRRTLAGRHQGIGGVHAKRAVQMDGPRVFRLTLS